ncbi:hypothetical protein J8I87_06400 [Paraburkholderia sp. LEh10]|uniref:hypothetical protein n=1 Tax=Paraburkholderia sp. LEh10 TaxID=2821353 RepID=UPI001AE93E64|nr:hypothetical protein [Paraburkholderia sp. LEh10]MBP0589354.1 hypothetical protein [Paraburkholderia sp. LEh10]
MFNSMEVMCFSCGEPGLERAVARPDKVGILEGNRIRGPTGAAVSQTPRQVSADNGMQDRSSPLSR